MEPLIILEQANVQYETAGGVKVVLKDVDLDIRAGQFIAVVGRNGSGKSTLLRVLCGLGEATGGRRKLSPETEGAIRIVFQNPDAQLVGETVFEEICFGLENIGVPTERMPELAAHALRSAGLTVSEHTPVDRLSGGQKQLLCLAAALVMNPKVLLLDEPASMLDPASKANLLKRAAELHRQGVTVVWSTQSMDEIGIADRVIMLDEGIVTFDGTPEHFFYGKAGCDGVPVPCLQLGLRLPYAVEVIHELLRAGVTVQARPVTDDQALEAVLEACR